MTWRPDQEDLTMPGRLVVNHVPIEDLRSDPRNARTHSRQQIGQIAESVREFGFVNPILLDETDKIIAGHARREAAAQLGLETVPVIRLSHLDEHQKRALAIADNKLPDNAGWDEELLARELRILSEVEVVFDVTITGFSQAEIDLRIESLAAGDDPEADKLPEPDPPEDLVVRRGDLFRLGQHVLLCGDATSLSDFEALMGDRKAQMVITDPPYNLRIAGHVSGLGRTSHDDFVMGSGEMTKEQFTAFLERALSNLARFSIDGSAHFACMHWRRLPEILAAGQTAYSELKQLCVWVKTNAGMGSFYRSQHELVLIFKNGAAPHINNFELGQHGRHRSNVWTYAGVNTLGAGRLEQLQMHPTIKPVAMIADAIRDCSKRRGIVLDCFAGSGTTLVAAERTGRRAYVMELDPKYVQTAIRRWEAFTGGDAVHVATGRTFGEIRETRGGEPGVLQATTNAVPDGPVLKGSCHAE
jgi:DNA modification methylase